MSYRMPTQYYEARLRANVAELGQEHPATRATFGRWVGRLGGTLSVMGSGRDAWVANYRVRGHSGFHNRTWRRRYPAAISHSWPPGGGCFTT